MEKKTTTCLVCDTQDFVIITYMFSVLIPKLFHKVAICKACGHIQMHPIPSQLEEKTNDDFFGNKYLPLGTPNPDNIKKRSKFGSTPIGSFKRRDENF